MSLIGAPVDVKETQGSIYRSSPRCDLRPCLHSHSDMNDHGVELVQSIRVLHVVTRIKHPQLHGKDHTISELDESAQRLLVFESLEVEGEDVGKPFNLHPKGGGGRQG